jgi:hypothetical protein
MEKDESDGYFRATVDLADGIFHYQFKSKKTFFFSTKTKFVCYINSSNKILV